MSWFSGATEFTPWGGLLQAAKSNDDDKSSTFRFFIELFFQRHGTLVCVWERYALPANLRVAGTRLYAHQTT